jgi:glycosyltransferase involved in cell wall biosynthesis
LENIGIPKKDITVFYVNTIDRDLEHISKAKKGIMRSKYNIGNDKKVILSVGRLEAEKNFPRLLELFTGLDTSYVLIIIGRGSLQDQLEKQAESLGIKDRLIFAGFVGRDQIWNYYLDSDLFILLSKAEALGLVFWEAMHVNVPVIGSIAPGILETVGKDGERGRIWKEEDGQQGFNERVSFCIDSNKEKNDMIIRAKEFVNEQRKNAVTFNDLSCFGELIR